jgi:hypothetical protein
LKEVERILREVADRVSDGVERGGTIRDANGNRVGEFHEMSGVFTVVIKMDNDIFQDMD